MLEWIEAHPGLASWVQAVFTVVAIGIAIWIPHSDRKESERKASLGLRMPLDRLLQGCLAARRYFESPANTPQKERIQRDLAEAHAALQSAQTVLLSTACARAVQEVREFASGFDDLFNAEQHDPVERKELAEETMQEIVRAFQALRTVAPDVITPEMGLHIPAGPGDRLRT